MRDVKQETSQYSGKPKVHAENSPAILEGGTHVMQKKVEQRKQTEGNILKSELLYRTIVENQAEMICCFLPDGTLTYANEAYCRYFGKRREELLDRTIFSHLSKDERASQEEHLRSLTLENPIAIIEQKLPSPEGVRWLQWNDRAIFDEQGNLVEIQSVGSDITKLKMAEKEQSRLLQEIDQKRQESDKLAEALAIERDKLRAVMENTSSHFAYLDLKFNFINVNDAYVKASGYSKEELIGHNYFNLFPDSDNRAIFQRVIETGEAVKFSSRPLEYAAQPQRETACWNWSLVPIKESFGKVHGLMLSLTDAVGSKLLGKAFRNSQVEPEHSIEERTCELLEDCKALQSEIANRMRAENELSSERRRFHLFAENAPFGMVFVDKYGNFRYINPKFKELFGYDLDEIPNGKEWFKETFPDSDYKNEAIGLWIEDARGLSSGLKMPRSFIIACNDGTKKIINFIFLKLDDEESLVTCEDITEGKRVLQKLRLAHKQLRDIIEFLPDATFVVEKDKKVIAWNRALEELTGIKKENIIGKGDYAYGTPFYRRPRPILIDLISSGDPEIETKYRYLERKGNTLYGVNLATHLPSGKEVVLWAKASPLLDGDGNVAGAVESIRDITERKKSEEALQVANEKLQALIHASPLAILTFDSAGKVQSWNTAAERIFGWREEEVLGNYPPFVPEDRKQEFSALIGIAFQGKIFTGVELQRRKKDGSAIDISLSSAPIRDAKGRIRGIMSVMDDITKRKAAERSLRENLHFLQKLIDTIPNPIYYKDTQRRIQGCNLAYERFVGLGKEDILGKTVYDIYPRAQADLCTSSDTDLFSNPGIKIKETTMHLQYDRKVEVISNKATYANEDGALAGLVEVIIDITELKRVEDELRKAKEAAEDAARVKSDFLANMSHEIRTPMNAVIGMTGLLLDADLPPEQRDCVETIRHSGNALLSIINNILDFSKIDGGKMGLERQPFDLRSCIEESLDLNAAVASEKGLNLAYFMHDSAPQIIIGDLTRLRQVLVNLISNAVKFTDQGEVVVSVSAGQAQGSSYEIQFAVRDSGIGISSENMDRLFSSFSQIDASTSRKYGGTGLGLAISKRLVELMSGRIWAESEVGKGSTFHFSIIAETLPGEPKPFLQLDQPKLAGKKILIVDSNETNLSVMSRLAKSWSMKPVTSAIAEEAQDLAKYESFDAAILGVGTQGIGLLPMSAEISKFQQAMPVILLTSFGLKKMDVSNGFAAIFTKPIKPAQLYEALIEIFDKKPVQNAKSLSHELDSTHHLRILLAEDNVINQKVAMRMLNKMGHRADLAANGLEVLNAIERLPYDVVLMDVQMPEMDGFEATKAIRQMCLPHQPRIIAITAYALDGDREKCLRAGMDDYISKPVQIRELAEALRKCRSLAREALETN